MEIGGETTYTDGGQECGDRRVRKKCDCKVHVIQT
jgi:hypothetical protein